jgi:hypothetical protein
VAGVAGPQGIPGTPGAAGATGPAGPNLIVAAGRFDRLGATQYNFGGLTGVLNPISGILGRLHMLTWPTFKAGSKYVVKAIAVLLVPTPGNSAVTPTICEVIEIKDPAPKGILLHVVVPTTTDVPSTADVMVEITELK